MLRWLTHDRRRQQQQQQQQQQREEEILAWEETGGGGDSPQEQSLSSSSSESAIRAVLSNVSLSEDEKCFLYIAIGERELYKKDPKFNRVQFTFETREDPNSPNRLTCVVERVNLKEKTKQGRFRKFTLTIIAPVIGALFSVYLRSCCFPTVQ
jgi:ATPase subunit of ABC transporter with duplicated ATPase domains